ncbi:MAG: hypothetical protein ACN4GZ_10060 [Acidimicrobiales bacterium]
MTDTHIARTSWLVPATPPPGFAKKPLPDPPSAPEDVNTRPKRVRKRSRTTEDRLPTPDQLRIQQWCDHLVVDPVPANGFYTERYYGPIVGPTCLLLLRTLASQLGTDREGFTVDTAELAGVIGCSSKAGPSSQFWKALRRGVRFGLLRQAEERVFVRTEISPLTARMVQRLPLMLRHEHRVWTRRTEPQPTTLGPPIDSTESVAALELLRLAARGLCTAEELRSLDRAHRLT